MMGGGGDDGDIDVVSLCMYGAQSVYSLGMKHSFDNWEWDFQSVEKDCQTLHREHHILAYRMLLFVLWSLLTKTANIYVAQK